MNIYLLMSMVTFFIYFVFLLLLCMFLYYSVFTEEKGQVDRARSRVTQTPKRQFKFLTENHHLTSETSCEFNNRDPKRSNPRPMPRAPHDPLLHIASTNVWRATRNWPRSTRGRGALGLWDRRLGGTEPETVVLRCCCLWSQLSGGGCQRSAYMKLSSRIWSTLYCVSA